MKIIIDIGHPAQVHYFKNFINIMKNRGHEFCITARDREHIQYLLKINNIDYYSRGKGGRNVLGKIIYILKADFILLKYGIKFKPDLFLSFGSGYAAHASKILGIPHIAFDDTEHAKFEHMLYVPFTECIITPNSFKKDFGQKHIRFSGSMDLAYLHPKYYISNKADEKEKYFVLRFVSWNASHDMGQKGLNQKTIRDIISKLKKHGKIIISSEGAVQKEYEQYLYIGDPNKMHSILEHATLFVGESGSMATEAAVLGTAAILINNLSKYCGVFNYIEKYGNLLLCENADEVVNRIEILMNDEKLKEKSLHNSISYIHDNINLTDFMVWFVENYPKSFSMVKQDPQFENKFKQEQ